MFETIRLNIACPECECRLGVEGRQVGHGGGLFCIACDTYISLVDSRGSLREAESMIRRSLADLSKKLTIKL